MLQEHRNHKLEQTPGLQNRCDWQQSKGEEQWGNRMFGNLCVTSQSTGHMVMIGPNDPSDGGMPV